MTAQPLLLLQLGLVLLTCGQFPLLLIRFCLVKARKWIKGHWCVSFLQDQAASFSQILSRCKSNNNKKKDLQQWNERRKEWPCNISHLSQQVSISVGWYLLHILQRPIEGLALPIATNQQSSKPPRFGPKLRANPIEECKDRTFAIFKEKIEINCAARNLVSSTFPGHW